jgi:hypothetical protein
MFEDVRFEALVHKTPRKTVRAQSTTLPLNRYMHIYLLDAREIDMRFKFIIVKVMYIGYLINKRPPAETDTLRLIKSN